MKHATVLASAACLMLLAVLAGALGAHALKHQLAPAMLEIWRTAVLYHLVHGLALMQVGLLLERRPERALAWVARLMLLGVVLFSGSLYALALGAPTLIGIVTPCGGVAWLVAWALLARAIIQAPEGTASGE